ncbi:MAG: cell division protein FtsQ/DivIB [Solirubrobacterales bacterium]
MAVRRKRSKKPILSLLLFLSVLVALYFFLHSSLFLIQKVFVSGNRVVSANEILKLSGIRAGSNIFDMKGTAAAKAIMIIPRVKVAEVIRHLPNEVEITITERKPWAYVIHGSDLLVIDDEGVCIEKNMPLEKYDLPIITFEGTPARVKEGQRLNSKAVKTVRKLILALPRPIAAVISDYHCDAKGQVFFYTVDGTEVRFGGMERLPEKIRLLTNALNLKKPDGSEQPLRYVDLRYKGLPVIRYK